MLTAATVTTNSRALWYLTRGFGLVALMLLTVTMVLGLTQAVRFARPGWPRFVLSALHKNASLLAVVLLVVHVVTALLDSYAPIRIVDVFIPFVSTYRPLWLGLGAISLDVLIALVVTSLLRERLGQRAWRAVHWAAFACWPLAVVHGIGTGSDTKLGWVLIIYVVCVAVVLASVWWRLATGWSIANATRRGAAIFASMALPLAVVAWTVTGPLRPGWARRSGTPAALLGSNVSAAASPAAGTSGSSAHLAAPFTSSFQCTQHQTGPDSNGLVSVTIAGTFRGTQSGQATIVLTGQPADGGGVQLTGSQVSLGPASVPARYQGHVTALQGTTLVADLTDTSGNRLRATFALQLTPDSSTCTGTVQVTA